jgi:hypothetical protein
MIETVLSQLVEQIRNERTVAITVSGSFARGDPAPYSDIDLYHYATAPVDAADGYRLFYHGGRLVSVSTTTIDDKRAELERPTGALWAVEGLRQARILYDPQGAFAALQAQANDFTWDNEAVNAFINRELPGYSEEALKILSGLWKENESAVLYGALGIVMGFSTLILIQRGILLRTENDYFCQARAAAAAFHARADFDIAAGYQCEGSLTPRMRGQAALRFFIATIRHMDAIIRPENRSVIETTIDIIEQSGTLSKGKA